MEESFLVASYERYVLEVDRWLPRRSRAGGA
jgi:hypothetical protein